MSKRVIDMWTIEERVIRCGKYIVETGCTVRTCAAVMGTSKSTVHKDVTERLKGIDPVLGQKVKEVLEKNLSERHLRGGESTRKKYARKHSLRECGRI